MKRALPRRAACLALAGLAVCATTEAGARPAARKAAAPARPDAALYRDARGAEERLRASANRATRRSEWEGVVLRYRKVVARFPRSGYCDNALLRVGDLYAEMGRRFRTPRYRDDAVAAYRLLVSEYPSSSLGEQALWSVVEIARAGKDTRGVGEAARAYLEAYPDAKRAAAVQRLLRTREPQAPVPTTPPPGLARIFDLRSWSGQSSTRVVIDLERKVEIRSDRAHNPDRLWVDLIGTRLHPNLSQRVFPVGDGLLEKVRVGMNREDVVRVVLDFKEVWEHQVFYLESPTRLVIDVRGPNPTGLPPAEAMARANPPSPAPTPKPAAASTASAPPPTARPSPSPGTTQPSPEPTALALKARPVEGLVAPPTPTPSRRATPAPIAITSTERQPASSRAPRPVETTAETPASARAAEAAPAAPTTPATNRAGTYSLARQLGLGARRIVIDAGHGGHDPGTIGRGGLQEKDLVLDVALRVARLVREQLGAEVVLTRSTDVYVPLEERTAIANSREADLFLSIHGNASPNPTARGIETYFLGFARTRHAEAVAARENAISPATLKDLQTLVRAIINTKIDESREFATSVQQGLVRRVGQTHAVSDRGVHSAPYYVLIGANMPAVLAEIAFVSNPEDERRLRKSEYREILAHSLLEGVRGYLEALNRTQLRQLTDTRAGSRVAKGKVRTR